MIRYSNQSRASLLALIGLIVITALFVAIPTSPASADHDGTVHIDNDGDGWTTKAGDCDDEDPNRYPGAEEIANGIDDDCDSSTAHPEEVDDDKDGYSEWEWDCDDDDDTIYPTAREISDGKDNDCDGIVLTGDLLFILGVPGDDLPNGGGAAHSKGKVKFFNASKGFGFVSN